MEIKAIRFLIMSVLVNALVVAFPWEAYVSQIVPQSITLEQMVHSPCDIVEAIYIAPPKSGEQDLHFKVTSWLYPRDAQAEGAMFSVFPAGTGLQKEAERLYKEKGISKSYSLDTYTPKQKVELVPSKRYILFVTGEFPDHVEFAAVNGFVSADEKTEILRLLRALQ